MLGARTIIQKPVGSPVVGDVLFQDDLSAGASEDQMVSARSPLVGTWSAVSGVDIHRVNVAARNYVRPFDTDPAYSRMNLSPEAADRLAIEFTGWLSTNDSSAYLRILPWNRAANTADFNATNPRFMIRWDRTGAAPNTNCRFRITTWDSDGTVRGIVDMDDPTFPFFHATIRVEARRIGDTQVEVAAELRHQTDPPHFVLPPTVFPWNTSGSPHTGNIGVQSNPGNGKSNSRLYGLWDADRYPQHHVIADNRNYLIP